MFHVFLSFLFLSFGQLVGSSEADVEPSYAPAAHRIEVNCKISPSNLEVEIKRNDGVTYSRLFHKDSLEKL